MSESHDPFDSSSGSTPDPPGWSLWLVYLYLRPRSFFRHYVVRSVPILTVIGAWAYGFSAAIDQFERNRFRGISGRPSYVWDLVSGDWGRYWAVALIGGAISGLLYYLIGGWWYRKRLEFSGASSPSPLLSRRVYIFSSQAYTIPFVLYVLWRTVTFDTPEQASLSGDWGWMAVLVCLLYSVYVSYRGVRTVFEVRAWPARTWFLILPGAIYGASVVAILIALPFLSGLDTPRVDRPLRIDREAFSLDYPGNWIVDTGEDDYDPDHSFVIEPFVADAAIRFHVYDDPVDPAEEVAYTLDGLAGSFDLGERVAIDRWGDHPGVGYRVAATIDGDGVTIVSFCRTTDRGAFEVLEICSDDVCEAVAPGFEQVRDSFVFRR